MVVEEKVKGIDGGRGEEGVRWRWRWRWRGGCVVEEVKGCEKMTRTTNNQPKQDTWVPASKELTTKTYNKNKQ